MSGQTLGAALLSAWFAAAVVSAAEPTVGQWGDPQRVVIEGAKTFPAEELRKALFRDVEVLLASHPLAPRSGLAPAVQRRLLAGFHKSGFADAQVTARLDEAAGTVVAVIDEGPRYFARGVWIDGAQQTSRKELHERLTRPYPPKEAVQAQFFQRGDAREVRWLNKDGDEVELADPVWTPGKPAALDKASANALREQVSQALAEFGYPFAEVEISVVPDPARRTAELLVVVKDEGPPALLGEIEIAGAEKNSRPAILAYLEIKPGELITHRRRAELEYRLWQSGRFLEHRVILLPPEGTHPAKLRLELKEYAPAPPLNASFSREEAALLQLRRWLHSAMQGNQTELVIQGEDENGAARVIFAPGRGLLATIAGRDPEGNLGAPAALLLSESEVGVYRPDQRFRLSSGGAEGQLTASISFSPSGNGETPFRIGFGFGVRTRQEGEELLPIDFAVSAAPVFLIGLAHEKNARTSWEQEVLTVTNDQMRFRVDARQGRVLDWEFAESSGGGPPFRFAVGEFAQERDRILQAAQHAPNLFDSARPISSLVGGLLDERLLEPLTHAYETAADDGKKPPDFSKLRLLRALAERGVFEPLDQLIVGAARAKEKDRFSIPAELGDTPPPQLLGYLAVIGLPAAEMLFPRDSWPWGLCRETALTLAGRPNYLAKELQRIHSSPDTGPLCCLATAALLKKGGMPHCELFAMRGLAELDAEDFLRDCRPLMDHDAVAGKSLQEAAAVLRKLEEPEVQELSRQLLPGDAVILEAAARELRRDRNEPLDNALPRALAAAWDAGLRQRIQRMLESYLPEDTFRLGRKP